MAVPVVQSLASAVPSSAVALPPAAVVPRAAACQVAMLLAPAEARAVAMPIGIGSAARTAVAGVPARAVGPPQALRAPLCSRLPPRASELSGMGAAALVVGAILRASLKRMHSVRRGRITMGIRRLSFPVMKHKTVTATKRMPLWQLDDEMYLKRQLAPHQQQTWIDIRRTQSRMKEMVHNQQKADMKEVERELTGFRFEPQYKIGELRQDQWLEGRVSGLSGHGVWVDCGVYNEIGEYVDGYLSFREIREDGRHIKLEDMTRHIHLGERVRVRVRQATPGDCTFTVSMRTQEDLPPLFKGKPRPWTFDDLEKGMKVKGIVRRVHDKIAFVDFGCDRLGTIHVSRHKRKINRKGFEKVGQRHKYAYTAFAKGAHMDFYILKADPQLKWVQLECTLPRGKPLRNSVEAEPDPMQRRDKGLPEGFQKVPGKQERLTEGQKLDREKAMEEKKPYEPYVPYVKEWIEDAMEPDDEQDSWVARTESELFEEMQAEAREAGDLGNDEDEMEDDSEEEDFDEAFADDEFAEDDFVDGEFAASAMPEGFSDSMLNASELDGWDFEDASINELDDDEEGEKLTEMQVEALLDGDDDYLERRPPKTFAERMEDKAKAARAKKGNRW
mmetsp:Transcript_86811/g.218525  ORF Transcript_86811/g.218525 Transcript_86811/m.218525 type:complete len:616 (-) Transcript_86811:72-1919(-)